MPLWEWLLDVAGVLLLLLLLFGIALVVRRRLLSREGGTFELSCRVRTGKPGRGWLLGLGRYRGETLEWFRIYSLSPWPKVVWPRTSLRYDNRREPVGSEALALYPDHVIIECSTPQGPQELAMSPGSLTGFQAWLEARPPGTDWSH